MRRDGDVVFLFIALSLSVLTYTLNANMISPLLPEISRRLGVDTGQVSWVSSLFFLSGSIAGIIFCRWSDFIGRKRMLLGCLATASLGTLVCIFAPSLPVLLFGRILQGASNAAFQLTFMILAETLRPSQLGTAIGAITAVDAAGTALGGYLGGIIARHSSYHYVFAGIFTLALVAQLFVRRATLSEPPRAEERSMDWIGAAVLSVALVSTIIGLSSASSSDWLAPTTLVSLSIGATAFLVFWQVESHGRWPLIEASSLRSRRVWGVLSTTTLTLSGVFAVPNFVMILLSQNGHFGFGLSPEFSALLFLAVPAVIGMVVSPAAGWIAGNWGWIPTMRVGIALSLATLVALAAVPFHILSATLAIATLGIFYNGMTLTPLNGLGVLLSPRDAPGALPGLVGAAFGLGASLGIAVIQPFVARNTASGFHDSLWISVGFVTLALGASWFVPHPSRIENVDQPA